MVFPHENQKSAQIEAIPCFYVANQVNRRYYPVRLNLAQWE